jgi:CPA2 family monovalent cation:H+ antiporter-2
MEPAVLLRDWPLVLLFTGLVIALNALTVTLGATLAGLPPGLGLRSGLALGQVGEFGFILLGAGTGLGVVDPSRYALLAAVCVATALATPALLSAGEPAAKALERRLTGSLRTYLNLYQSWARTLKAPALRKAPGAGVRRAFFWLLLDGVGLGAVAVLAPRLLRLGTRWLEGHGPLGHALAQGLLLLVVAAVTVLFLQRILLQSKVLAEALLDLPGAGPRGTRPALRRAFRGGLRAAALLLAGLPVLAALEALVPLASLGAFAVFLLLALPLLLWRRAQRLQRELEAGPEWMAEGARDPWEGPAAPAEAHGPAVESGWRTLRVGPRCPSLGRSLGELDLAGQAGVVLVALLRGGHLLEPRSGARLEDGDLLALSGSARALEAAERILGAPHP